MLLQVLELVGTSSLEDSLQCTREHAIVCMTGMVGNKWYANREWADHLGRGVSVLADFECRWGFEASMYEHGCAVVTKRCLLPVQAAAYMQCDRARLLVHDPCRVMPD